MTEYPYVRVDLQHRMLTVMLNDGKIESTDQLDDVHLVDVDADGRVVGIDILTLDDFKIDEMAQRFGFTDQAAAIKAAIRTVLSPQTTTVASVGKQRVVAGEPKYVIDEAAETQPKRPEPEWQLPV